MSHTPRFRVGSVVINFDRVFSFTDALCLRKNNKCSRFMNTEHRSKLVQTCLFSELVLWANVVFFFPIWLIFYVSYRISFSVIRKLSVNSLLYQILNYCQDRFLISHNIISIYYLTLELTTYFSKQYLAKIDINESTRSTS